MEAHLEQMMRERMRAAGFFRHFDEDVGFERIGPDLIKLKLYHRGHPSGTIFIEGSVPLSVFLGGELELVLTALLAELEREPEIIQKRTPNRGGHQSKIDALRRIAKDQAGKPEGENAARLLEKLQGKPAQEPRPVYDFDPVDLGDIFGYPSRPRPGDDHVNARSAYTNAPPNWYRRAADLDFEAFMARLRRMQDAFGGATNSMGGLGQMIRDELDRLERLAEEFKREQENGQEHKD